jgi:hypothetical protein
MIILQILLGLITIATVLSGVSIVGYYLGKLFLNNTYGQTDDKIMVTIFGWLLMLVIGLILSLAFFLGGALLKTF